MNDTEAMNKLKEATINALLARGDFLLSLKKLISSAKDAYENGYQDGIETEQAEHPGVPRP